MQNQISPCMMLMAFCFCASLAAQGAACRRLLGGVVVAGKVFVVLLSSQGGNPGAAFRYWRVIGQKTTSQPGCVRRGWRRWSAPLRPTTSTAPNSLA